MTDSSEYFMDDRAPEQPKEETRKRNVKQDLPYDAGLPASIDAEKTVLGAILLEPSALIEAEEKLETEDFSLDSHQKIYKRMGELARDGHAVDLVTLTHELARHKEIESVGGVAFLASLTEGLPRRPIISEYVRIIKDKSLLRRLMVISNAAIARAADQSEAAMEIGLALASQVQDAVTSSAPSTLERAGDFLNYKFPTARAMTEKTAKSQGLETGFRDFDEMTCGLQKGSLYIFAARPSMGKSAFMTGIAEHVGINSDRTVAIFSMEMPKEMLLNRAICSRAHVPLQDFLSGTMTSRMMEEFEWAYAEMERSKIYIDDVPKSAQRIGAVARSMKAKNGLDLVLIDYLGLFVHEETKRGSWNQAAEVGLDVLTMKRLAHELGVPVGLLCQLNRDSIKRDDKRPNLGDLRGSGSIEEHADTIAFIHRPGYHDKTDESLKHKAEIILAKSRNGPTGTVHLHWEESYTRFSDPIDPNDYQYSGESWWNK